MPWEELSDV